MGGEWSFDTIRPSEPADEGSAYIIAAVDGIRRFVNMMLEATTGGGGSSPAFDSRSPCQEVFDMTEGHTSSANWFGEHLL